MICVNKNKLKIKMEKLNQVQTHYTNQEARIPSGLKSAQEISETTGIALSRLLELTDSHYIPHWRIDNGDPLFQLAEVKTWIATNLVNRIQGCKLPIELRVMIEPPPAEDAPEQIREIQNLRSIPLAEYPPGVYFLVHKNRVLYVGQSINPIARIPQHKDKLFSRAYMIPVPSSELDSVEGALIRALNPPLNSGARETAYGPGDKKEDTYFIAKYATCLLDLIERKSA